MLSLIWKDFYINRSQLLWPTGLLLAVSVLGVTTGSSGALMYLKPLLTTYSALIVPFFALNSVTLEEKNRTLSFLRTLPMSPDNIVASKFLAPLLAGLVWAGAAALVLAVTSHGLGENTPGSVSALLITLCVALPVTAIELVVFFMFGAGASRASTLVIWGVGYLAIMAASSFGVNAERAYEVLLNPAPKLIALAAAGSLLVYGLCMLLAQAIFRRKEI